MNRASSFAASAELGVSRRKMPVAGGPPAGWGVVKLGDVAKVIMGQSPKSETYNTDRNGMPFYQGVADFGERFVTPRVYCTAPKTVIGAGDILLSVRAPVGRVNITQEDCSVGRGNAGVKAKDGDQRFLYYLLKCYEERFEAVANGTVFSSISGGDIKKMDFAFPPIAEQQAIAGVLSALDDAAEVLRRQNETLRNIAQAMFHKRFVADADAGWEKAGLATSPLATLIGSGIDAFPGEKTYLATANVQGEIVRDSGVRITHGNRPARANMQPAEYSVWFAKKGDVRKVLMFDAHTHEMQNGTILSTGFSGLKTTADSHYYVWCFVAGDAFQHMKDNLVSGTVQPDINNAGIDKIVLPVPPPVVLREFNARVEPLYAKLHGNNEQIRTLQNLRDVLLPELVSGRVLLTPP